MRLHLGLEENAHTTHVPLIEIVYKDPKDPKVVRFFDDLSLYTHLVFTSPRTVDAFINSAPIPELPIFSVGKRTTERLLEEGAYRITQAAEENQEGVLHQILLSDFSNAYIGIPCSEKARPSLSIALGYRGIRHQVGPLYDTQFAQDVSLPDFEGVTELHFTSPSTVDAFARLHTTIPEHILCFVRGKSTGDHLRQVFPNVRMSFQ